MRYAPQLQHLQQQQEEEDTQLVQDDNLLSDVTACSPVSCARFARSLSRPCPTLGPPPEQISNPSTSPVTSPRRHVAPTSPRIPFSSKRFPKRTGRARNMDTARLGNFRNWHHAPERVPTIGTVICLPE
ncbi:hypothetical protein FVE85_3378 [Porphyridium purpureum]|uniref:Uncharacterized protein n=1 Tax=Porphyridium purpureum TaxID=35688 RepID=A0A5J4YXE8_PORPP|nr:hypothetical protein FVE85_3378 [Porphyridium purpureum]|eukprot:POR9763..scf227_4